MCLLPYSLSWKYCPTMLKSEILYFKEQDIYFFVAHFVCVFLKFSTSLLVQFLIDHPHPSTNTTQNDSKTQNHFHDDDDDGDHDEDHHSDFSTSIICRKEKSLP
jgi:hypothetical protein